MGYLILFATIYNLILGVFVLVKQPKRLNNKLFACFCVFASYWALSNFLCDYLQSDFWLKNSWAAGALVAPLGLIWLLNLIGKKISKLKIGLIAGSGIFFFILTTTTKLIINRIESITYGNFEGSFGPLYPVYSIYSIIILLIIFYCLYTGLKTSKGIKKAQLKYVSVGVLGYALIPMVVSFILPNFGISQFTKYDSPSSIIFLTLITYAIVRHRLMDIRLVFKKGLVYSLMLVLVWGAFSFLIIVLGRFFENVLSLNYILVASLAAFLIAVLFHPLRSVLTKSIDKTVFPKSQAPKVDDEIIQEFQRNTDMAKLGRDILKAINQSLKINECYFLALDRRADIYKIEFVDSQKERETFTLASNDPFTKALAKENKIIVKEEIPFMVDLQGENKTLENIETKLKSLDFALVAPFYIDKELIGILFLGEKTKNNAFSVQDIRFLEIVVKEATFALANVLAYKYAMERVFELKKRERES